MQDKVRRDNLLKDRVMSIKARVLKIIRGDILTPLLKEVLT